MPVHLCGFRHISTSGLGVSASRASFIAVFGRPLQVTVHPMLRGNSALCLVCIVGVLWLNGWMDQGATWCGGRPRPRRHCVRWEWQETRRCASNFLQPVGSPVRRHYGVSVILASRHNLQVLRPTCLHINLFHGKLVILL